MMGFQLTSLRHGGAWSHTHGTNTWPARPALDETHAWPPHSGTDAWPTGPYMPALHLAAPATPRP
jgi:hypothetical protein